MKTPLTTLAVAVAMIAALAAQEPKKVPKDSMRVSIPGCAKGYVFTTGPRSADEAGSTAVPEGMHLRMNGPRKLMKEIKGHQGSMLEITGLMRKDQIRTDGVAIGGGVRVGPAPQFSGAGGGVPFSPAANEIMIDVEGWRPIVGNCPS